MSESSSVGHKKKRTPAAFSTSFGCPTWNPDAPNVVCVDSTMQEYLEAFGIPSPTPEQRMAAEAGYASFIDDAGVRDGAVTLTPAQWEPIAAHIIEGLKKHPLYPIVVRMQPRGGSRRSLLTALLRMICILEFATSVTQDCLKEFGESRAEEAKALAENVLFNLAEFGVSRIKHREKERINSRRLNQERKRPKTSGHDDTASLWDGTASIYGEEDRGVDAPACAPAGSTPAPGSGCASSAAASSAGSIAAVDDAGNARDDPWNAYRQLCARVASAAAMPGLEASI